MNRSLQVCMYSSTPNVGVGWVHSSLFVSLSFTVSVYVSLRFYISISHSLCVSLAYSPSLIFSLHSLPTQPLTSPPFAPARSRSRQCLGISCSWRPPRPPAWSSLGAWAPSYPLVGGRGTGTSSPSYKGGDHKGRRHRGEDATGEERRGGDKEQVV